MDIIDIATARKEPEVKRLQPDTVNAPLVNDVQASLTAFQATGLVVFLKQAKKSLDHLLQISGE